MPPWSQPASPLHPETPCGQLTAWTRGFCEGVPSSSGARERVEDCSSLCLPSQDEYMADLYHFSTKEDSYASYFIKVSPLSHSSSACECLLEYV